jgi:hypothetical protein
MADARMAPAKLLREYEGETQRDAFYRGECALLVQELMEVKVKEKQVQNSWFSTYR